MELLDASAVYAYPAEIGPGVYDVRSPRVAAVEEMTELVVAAPGRLAPDQIWLRADRRLETWKRPEIEAAIASMVTAAKTLRGGH